MARKARLADGRHPLGNLKEQLTKSVWMTGIVINLAVLIPKGVFAMPLEMPAGNMLFKTSDTKQCCRETRRIFIITRNGTITYDFRALALIESI